MERPDGNDNTPEAQLPADVLAKRAGLLQRAEAYVEALDTASLAGNKLRKPQALAVLGFKNWLAQKKDKPEMMGHLVLPMGSGKTLAAAASLAEIAGGKTLYFTWTNNLGEDAIDAYEQHQLSKGSQGNGTAGRCFGGAIDLDGDFVVCTFDSFEKRGRMEINPDDVQLIVIDEADVNGLSDRRFQMIEAFAKETGAPVVAMSATERQSTGKDIKDFYPDKITRLAMPDSLLQLREWGLLSQMVFEDLYFDLQLEVDAADLRRRRDIDPAVLENFVKSPYFTEAILKHFIENHKRSDGTFPRAAVVFRNNGLLDAIMAQAQVLGINIARFTGEETPADLADISNRFEDGEIDMIVGSNMLGRGLHLNFEVVYNALVGYSPQRHWQALGRGFEMDEEDLKREAHLITVLPRRMVDKHTGRDLEPEERPLCSGVFFDPDFYNGGALREKRVKVNPSTAIKIGDIEVIRSVDEVAVILDRYWKKPVDFQSRTALLARYIDLIGYDRALTQTKIDVALHKTLESLREIVEGLTSFAEEPGLHEARVGDISWEAQLSRTEERELVLDYKMGQGVDDPELMRSRAVASERLLKAYLPLISAIARQLASNPSDVDDLIQEGSICFFERLDSINPDISKVSLVKWVSKRLFWRMQMHAWLLYAPAAEVTENGDSDIKKRSGFPHARILDRSRIDRFEEEIRMKEGRELSDEDLWRELGAKEDLHLEVKQPLFGKYRGVFSVLGLSDEFYPVLCEATEGELAQLMHLLNGDWVHWITAVPAGEPRFRTMALAGLRARFQTILKKIRRERLLDVMSKYENSSDSQEEFLNGLNDEVIERICVAFSSGSIFSPTIEDAPCLQAVRSQPNFSLFPREDYYYMRLLEDEMINNCMIILNKQRVGRKPFLQILSTFLERAAAPRRKLEKILAELDWRVDVNLEELVDDVDPLDDRLDQVEKLRKLKSRFEKLLSERQRFLLTQRYGLDGEEELTLDAVGNKMGGLSRERVRQIEREAVLRLRDADDLPLDDSNSD